MAAIEFRICDGANGSPIAGALIRGLNSVQGDWAGKTDAKGVFSANLAVPQPYHGIVSAEGYQTREIPWFFKNGHIVSECLEAGHPPPPPPFFNGDAIDVGAALITEGTPDIASRPIGTTITEFEIRSDGSILINFTRRDGPNAWPPVNGAEGQIQYTLGVGCKIGGLWYLSTPILCIARPGYDNYVPTGPTLDPGQLPRNWYYYANQPLSTYQPQPREQVAWFVVAGAMRRGDIHTVAERSNVIVAPFQVGKFV